MSDSYAKLVSGVKEHQAPSCLEEHRMQIYQEWIDGDEETNHCVSESEAISMAIGHNHVQYIEHLLLKSPVHAMRTAGFSCSHLARAVESDRPVIVRKLLRHTLKLPSSDQRSGVSHQNDNIKSKKTSLNYLNRPSGCMMSGPSKTSVHLACELGRAGCLGELLHHGAIPNPEDNSGLNPLDHALRKLCNHNNKSTPTADIILALKRLIPFLPVVRVTPETLELVQKTTKQQDLPFELRGVLQWILGEINTPRSLQQICRHRIRSVIGQAGIEPVPVAVCQLPLPNLIKRYLFAAV